jgi:phasin
VNSDLHKVQETLVQEQSSEKTYAIPEDVKDFADRSVVQAHKAFDGFLDAAGKAIGTVEDQATALHTGAFDASRLALQFAGDNMMATFAHARRLMQAKDVSEVLQIQSEYLKQQSEAMRSQTQAMGQAIRPKKSS